MRLHVLFVLMLAFLAACGATTSSTSMLSSTSDAVIPTPAVTSAPTVVPATAAPTIVPTNVPTVVPATAAPTVAPTAVVPTIAPTVAPTQVVTAANGRIYFLTTVDENTQLAVVNHDGTEPQILTHDSGSILEFTFAPDRQRIALTLSHDYNADIYLMNTDGSDLHPLVASPRDESNPVWSPDGSTIAFVTRMVSIDCAQACNEDIFSVYADGSNLTQLTTDELPDRRPIWSPNGKFIAFERGCIEVTLEDCPRRVYAMHADGSVQVSLAPKLEKSFLSDWSPDGSDVLLQGWDAQQVGAYSAQPDGSQLARRGVLPQVFDDHTSYSFTASPDGKRIAFVHQDGECQVENCTRNVYVMNADGTQQTQLTSDGTFNEDPAWSPDGQRIAFISDRDGKRALYAMNADGSEQRRLSSNAGDDCCVRWMDDTVR